MKNSRLIVWNAAKQKANLEKHGLDFADADWVLGSRYRLDIATYRNGERRTLSLAYVFDVLVVLVLVHTHRKREIRIVSFRPASELERSAYHDWLENDFDHLESPASGASERQEQD